MVYGVYNKKTLLVKKEALDWYNEKNYPTPWLSFDKKTTIWALISILNIAMLTAKILSKVETLSKLQHNH